MLITQYNMVITQYNMVITIGISIITQYQHTYVHIYIYICIVTGWWFGTFGLFSHILGIRIPTDELIFFRGVETTNQL